MTGDGGAWLRKQCLIMAQNNHTPVSYWLSVPLLSLAKWIKASNGLVREQQEARKNRPKTVPIVIKKR